MIITKQLAALVIALIFAGCGGGPEKKDEAPVTRKNSAVKPEVGAAESFTGEKVPVLCYHAIRDLDKNDSADKKAYSVSPSNFELQMKALSDNGYSTITPDELKEYYTNKKPLPEKPVMITFDDGRKEQFTIAAGIMEKYNFKGVFFIMTVSLGKKQFMTSADVKALSERGHIIGSHTWDHHMVTKYKGEDWELQFAKPKRKLEEITQKPVTSFAYPHGVWSAIAADSLKANGFTTAFLFGEKQDADRPLYTFERVNVPYSYSVDTFLKVVEKQGRNK